MMKLLGHVLVFVSAVLTFQSGATAQPASSPAAIVAEILSRPDDQLDYGRAKLAFDRIVDPSIDADATLARIDRLAREAGTLAGARASPAAKLSALRRVIYERGPWNGNRPFSYDHNDPLGRNVRNKLISTYLATRRGNCVSMPVLFLIAGERMGLTLALSTAPLHIFLRYTDEGGREISLEATSGALPARLEWFRKNLPMRSVDRKRPLRADADQARGRRPYGEHGRGLPDGREPLSGGGGRRPSHPRKLFA